jgi:hypothetical protein
MSTTSKRRHVLGLAAILGVGAAGVASLAALRPGVAQSPTATPPAARKDLVRITVSTVPFAKASITWGKKRLGLIQDRRRPFVLERPRDSGPLDVTIRADGFLPVHTRAYTFSDTKLTVRLTPVGDKHKLFGYRAPLPDAGAPPDDAGAP